MKIKHTPKKFKIKHKPKEFKIKHKPRKFKIKHNVLQNKRTQTHESPVIQQKESKSNTKSIQGTQKHKLKNTNPFKHKHNISNTIAQIQAQIQIKTDTNIARISTSFKIFNISSIFLLTKHKITKKKDLIYRQISVLEMKKERKKK